MQKTPRLSYPGELPDLDHRTISLRTQLRLSYETYSWLRYLTWTGLLFLAILLLILPGGFPPRSAVLLWQMLPLTGRLVAMHGATALFSLAALALQSLTWLLLWSLLLAVCGSLGRYTWRLYRSQNLLEGGWLPSSALVRASEGSSEPQAAPATLAQAAIQPAAFAPAAPTGQQTRSQARAAAGPAASPGREAAGLATVRQFALPTIPLNRPRIPAATGESSSGGFASGLGLGTGPGVIWDVGISRRGRPNEDSVLALRGTCNFADQLQPFELHIVADGMGGHAHGRLASHLAIRGMLETVIPGLVACNAVESEQIVDILIDGVHWANQVIYQYGQEQQANMGTTITATLLLAETAYIINVGDSRTYIYRPGAGLTQITRDHSLVARLVETGAISPDEIYTHPDRNKVYRGLGDKTDVTVDWFILPVQPGDLLLLCSDGLWEMVRDRQIAEILQTYASSPVLASNALLCAALLAGGNDNVGLLVVKV